MVQYLDAYLGLLYFEKHTDRSFHDTGTVCMYKKKIKGQLELITLNKVPQTQQLLQQRGNFG